MEELLKNYESSRLSILSDLAIPPYSNLVIKFKIEYYWYYIQGTVIYSKSSDFDLKFIIDMRHNDSLYKSYYENKYYIGYIESKKDTRILHIFSKELKKRQ